MDANVQKVASGLTGLNSAQLQRAESNNAAGGKKGAPPPPDYQAAVEAQGPAINWGKDFGTLGNGQAAADAVYNQATARLDPQWTRREDALRTRLANQGITDETSEPYKAALSEFGNDRNDAYGAAFANSFDQGQGLFKTNLMARQQAIAEALRRRAQPLEELGLQQGLWEKNGELAAANNPLNGLSDLLGAGLNIAGLFGLGG